MVNVNPAYRAHELEYVLRQSGITLLIASLSHKGSDYRAIVDEVRDRCPALRETVYIGDPTWDALGGVLRRCCGRPRLRPRLLRCWFEAVSALTRTPRCVALRCGADGR